MDTKQFLKDLRAERDRINDAIAALEALNGSGVTQTVPAPDAAKTAKSFPVASVAGKRVVSPEARQRMADAQKKRYAKAKRAAKKAAIAAPVAKTSAKAVPATTASVKRVGKPMSEATKKKLAAAAKASWARKKSAAPAAKKTATA
jgi:hypothetical protein